MKTILIKLIISSLSGLSFLICLWACYQSHNQQSDIVVPPAVKAAFQAKYPNISHTWQKHDYGYEALFKQNNIEYEAEFSDTGVWLETEYYVTEKDFPPVVLKRIKEKRPGFRVTKYEIEITSQGIFYEVDITDGELEEELYFDKNGNFQKDLYED